MSTISKSDPKSAVCAVKQPPEKTLQPESGSGKNSAVCLHVRNSMPLDVPTCPSSLQTYNEMTNTIVFNLAKDVSNKQSNEYFRKMDNMLDKRFLILLQLLSQSGKTSDGS